MSLELPHPLGPFLLLRHLASGGMGDVYLAHQSLGDVGGERLCVVKTVRSELGRADDTLLLRFMDEARTTAFLTHKNVASVIDVGRAEGVAYLAVEHVAGRDLQSVMKRAKRVGVRIPEEVSLYIIGELLDALAYVHQAKHPRSLEDLKIVHRDISPHNVMTSFAGEVKLIDFGIARSTVKRELTQAGQAIGKVRYMSPEQARAEPVDAATDVWAASILATELLSGKSFWGDKPLEAILMSVAMGQKPRPPGLLALDKPMRHALKAGLHIDREKRPSAAALKERIFAASAARPSTEALRALLRELFDGEEQQERQAHALLLQEPTSVQAAGLLSHTANEDAVDDDMGLADADAPTASRIATPLEEDALDDDSNDDIETIAQPLRSLAKRAPTSPTPFAPAGRPSPTRTTSAVSPPPSRKRSGGLSPLAAAAGAILATCAVTAVAILVVRSLQGAPVEAPAPVVDAAAAVVPPPTPVEAASVYDPPPEDRSHLRPAPPVVDLTKAVPPPVDATRPVAPIVDVAKPAAPVVDVAKPARPEHARPRVKAKEARPVLFGDRVRALRACRPAPTCAAPVLRRAGDVAALSADELKALDGDVDWCLEQCR